MADQPIRPRRCCDSLPLKPPGDIGLTMNAGTAPSGRTLPKRCSASCAARCRIEHTLARPRSASGYVEADATARTTSTRSERRDRQSGGPAWSRAGLEADLRERLAGRRRCQSSPVEMYPDQSLYPANSVPELVRRINRALLQRADQISNRSRAHRSGHRVVSRRSLPTPRPDSVVRSTPHELMK